MDVQLRQSTPVPITTNASETFWQQLVSQNQRPKRNYPRIHADISVHILGIEAKPIKVQSRDISFGGLQIRCNPETSQRLLRLSTDVLKGQENPDPDSLERIDGIEHMKLQIRLVVASRVHKIQCLARVAHYVQVPESVPGQEIAIGFQFLGFKDQDKQILNSFIEENLIPAGF